MGSCQRLTEFFTSRQLVSVLILTIALISTDVQGQIVDSDENYSSVRINMCCDLNLQFGGASCSSNGESDGNTNVVYFNSEQDQQKQAAKSRSERQIPRRAEWSVPSQHMANNQATIFA